MRHFNYSNSLIRKYHIYMYKWISFSYHTLDKEHKKESNHNRSLIFKLKAIMLFSLNFLGSLLAVRLKSVPGVLAEFLECSA